MTSRVTLYLQTMDCRCSSLPQVWIHTLVHCS